MNTSASSQLEAIQSMMASGHRSVYMERHTLWMWGIAAAALILLVDVIFSAERFPDVALRSLFAHALFIVPVLVITGIVDFRMTRSARRKRDESISFVQMQITKVWWMLIGLIVLINMGMNFFGGGLLFYGVTLAIMGIAFFINGLFSQQMLSWIGCALILMGLAMVLFQVPYALQEWLAAGVFGLGFPALAVMLNREAVHASLLRRFVFTVIWLAVVLLPAHLVFHLELKNIEPTQPVIDLATYQQQGNISSEVQVVRLPKGTRIPVHIEFSGDLLQSGGDTVMQLTLMQPVDISIRDGKPQGPFRIGDMHWSERMYGVLARTNKLEATLTPEDGPRISLQTSMVVKE